MSAPIIRDEPFHKVNHFNFLKHKSSKYTKMGWTAAHEGHIYQYMSPCQKVAHCWDKTNLMFFTKILK